MKRTTRCNRKPGLRLLYGVLAALTLFVLAAGTPAYAQLSGAIFTVNGNLYTNKTDVYLDGGPQGNAPCSAAGLPDGHYYFQVTDPPGATLLSSDAISEREVTVSGGLITAYLGTHTVGSGKCAGGISVALAPFDDTLNSGGEYKVWMTPIGDYDATDCPNFGFCDSKTDNFKVKKSTAAYVTVCKFNDQSNDGVRDAGEPLIPHWPIYATGVDAGDLTNQSVSTQTDDFGCVSFAVSKFPSDGPQTVTLTEGTLGVDWTQTAPGNGTYNANGNSDSSGPTTVSVAIPSDSLPASGGVISVSLQAGDSVTAPNFGNFNPNCATDCGGANLVVTKDANPSYKFTWGIEKSVDTTQINTSSGSATFNYTVKVTHDDGSGWQVTGNIKVSNPTLADLTGINVTDAVDNGGTCSITDTNHGLNETVEAGEHIDLPYTCTYTSLPGAGTNTATATTSDGGTVTGTATVDFTNAQVDGSVTVTDPLDPSSPRSFSYADTSPITYGYAHMFTGDLAGTCTSHKNTATFTATGDASTTGSASQTVKQCVGADLTVSKTASTAFKRTFNWNISKSVDKTKVDQDGGSVTFNYTVKASETGFTDSGWTVGGTITVANPNDWESITANLADSIDSGGSCAVTGGTGVVLTAKGTTGASATLPYTCTYTSAPSASSGTNTAAASWSGSATPDSLAQGTATYAFGAPTSTVNATIAITDTFNGVTTPLGTLTGATSTYAYKTYTYSHTINVPAFGCQSYTNTATTGLTGTGQSSSQTVQVCGPAKTGALTMGFWQNKNGQGIITGGAYTGSGKVCNSGTSLRQFAPFQDLSSTATCSAVATYVYNVIKAANASGASMNAMLKAQDLATSLDVLFSTSGLGGVAIDLTKVCSVSDQSNGTGTCSGTYINTSAAFGGATSLTVLQIMAYAASQSNVGGSTWYGNVKNTQFLAKDTFDAINNQLAFAP